MSTGQSVLIVASAWAACALLSSHAFLMMLRNAEARTGRSVALFHVALLIALWPLTWLAVAINCMYVNEDERGGDE